MDASISKHQFQNRDVIKYIAMFTMLLNHIASIFLKEGTFLYELFTAIGYFTAITMIYFLVEGYHYTHSKKNYMIRLFIFAVISEVPFCLAFTQKKTIEFAGLNMLFTLCLCFLLVWVFDSEKSPFIKFCSITAALILSLFSDWAVLGPVYALLFIPASNEPKPCLHGLGDCREGQIPRSLLRCKFDAPLLAAGSLTWSRNSKKKIKIAFGLSVLIFGAFSLMGGIGRFSLTQNILFAIYSMIGMALSGICILFFYNGKRMKKGRLFSKWFFYIFYPGHLLILGIIRIALRY